MVSIPVSGRASGPELGNAVGVLPVRIPFTDDLDARFAAVRVARKRLHAGHRGSSTALLGPAFRVLAALGALQWFVRHQRLVHTFETNIRGPEQMPTVFGVRVARVVPMAVNPGNVTVSFDVLSLGGWSSASWPTRTTCRTRTCSPPPSGASPTGSSSRRARLRGLRRRASVARVAP